MKMLMIAAATVAAIASNVANAAPLPEAKPDDVGFSQQGLTRLDDFFAREIAAKRVPGAVVAIARNGKLVHYKAYGQLDAGKGTAMPLDAIFALASMTKPMAAVAGLTLMEQGRLPLQAKVADYFPGFGDMKVKITVAVLAKKFGVRPPGWEAEAATWHSVADVDSAETMAEARVVKRQMKSESAARPH